MRVATALLTAALVMGCKGKKDGETVESSEEWQSQVTERELPEQGLIEQEVDLDVDGQPDIVNYYRERTSDRLLVKKKLDLNRDGTMDLVSYFDDDGRLKKEEMDSDYDGHFDWTDHTQVGPLNLSLRRTSDGAVLEDDVSVCKHLVDVGNVAIVPGSGFGAPGFARLSYACAMDDIRRGVERIANTLGALSD